MNLQNYLDEAVAKLVDDIFRCISKMTVNEILDGLAEETKPVIDIEPTRKKPMLVRAKIKATPTQQILEYVRQHPEGVYESEIRAGLKLKNMPRLRDLVYARRLNRSYIGQKAIYFSP